MFGMLKVRVYWAGVVWSTGILLALAIALALGFYVGRYQGVLIGWRAGFESGYATGASDAMTAKEWESKRG
jgi:hypothetical protein